MLHPTVQGVDYLVEGISQAVTDISSASAYAREQGHKDEGDSPCHSGCTFRMPHTCKQSEQLVASRGFLISRFWHHEKIWSDANSFGRALCDFKTNGDSEDCAPN